MAQSNQELLDQIYNMIETFKDKRQKLIDLHDLIFNHYYVQPKPESPDIPENYRPVVHEIAEMLEETVYVVNPETCEFVSFPMMGNYMILGFEEMEDRIQELEKELGKDGNIKKELETGDIDQLYYDEYLKMRDWENKIQIDPPRSKDSYRIMENFVHSLPTGKVRNDLLDAISRKKPFRNFNAIIHNSSAREQWFKFRQQEHEKYVWNEIDFGLRYPDQEDDDEEMMDD